MNLGIEHTNVCSSLPAQVDARLLVLISSADTRHPHNPTNTIRDTIHPGVVALMRFEWVVLIGGLLRDGSFSRSITFADLQK